MIENLDDLTNGVNPFGRYDWSGRLVSLDGTATDDFTKADVAEVIASGVIDEGYDGEVAAVLRLNDGRYVTYETFWGPTGSGFCEDAYGGDADLSFASTLATAVRFGLTDDGRRLCRVSITAVPGGADELLALVGRDRVLAAQRSTLSMDDPKQRAEVRRILLEQRQVYKEILALMDVLYEVAEQ